MVLRCITTALATLALALIAGCSGGTEGDATTSATLSEQQTKTLEQAMKGFLRDGSKFATSDEWRSAVEIGDAAVPFLLSKSDRYADPSFIPACVLFAHIGTPNAIDALTKRIQHREIRVAGMAAVAVKRAIEEGPYTREAAQNNKALMDALRSFLARDDRILSSKVEAYLRGLATGASEQAIQQ